MEKKLLPPKMILAIDLGTSGPKVALVSTSGDVIDHEFEPTKTFYLPRGGAEENPAEWWNSILVATKRLLKKELVPVEDIIAVCCTSQWSGTVAVDKEGNHLMNAITWMDSRGAKYTQELTRGLINIEGYSVFKLKKWISRTGGIPLRTGKDSIAHILYIKNKHPEIYQKTYKFLEPKDYLNLKLTGCFYASTESITLHWVTDNRDVQNIKYDDGLIKQTGVSRNKLPELKQAVEVIGPLKTEIAKELGLNPKTLVVMGTPDLHSGAIGSGAVEDYAGHLYIGTSSWLLCHVPFKKTDLFHNMGSLPSAIPGKYLLMNEQETAAEALNFLKNNIIYPDDELTPNSQIKDIHCVFNRLAETIAPGSDNLIFTPWLNGERSPVDDATVKGGFYNLSLKTTRSHMVRAVLEGIAYNSNWLLKYVERFNKKPMPEINIIGGGARSDVWCQIHADVLNRTMRRVEDPINANARGAGLLAAVALGYTTFNEIPKKIKFDRIFKPKPENRAVYQKLFKEFVNIYHKNKKIYQRLNQF